MCCGPFNRGVLIIITLITNGAPTHEYGVKSLVSYLQANDVPVRAVYMNYCGNFHKRLKKQILDIVKDSKLVGFSLMSKDVNLFMPLIYDIRHKLKIPVVSGGIHPTALPEESLMFSDYVCIGEGEEPLRQLYSALEGKTSFREIPNIGYREDNGDIVINRVKYFVDNLDGLPFPDYQFETSYYYDQIKIVKITAEIRAGCFESFYFYSQRGCKLACAYCSNSIYSRLAKKSCKKWYRKASAKRVINELKTHLKNFPRVKMLTFNDDDFLARSNDELAEITSFVKHKLKIAFTINGIPSFITEEKVKLLVDNGLAGIAFGIQSGSARILKNIYKRPVPIESVLKAIDVITKFNEIYLNIDYGFILDNPYEEKDEWLETLNLIKILPEPKTISLYSLAFFPGTALTGRAVKDMLVDEGQFSDYKKDYRSDISYSFKNTVIFLYSYFNIPAYLDSLLLSEFMLHSRIASPLRFIIAYPLAYCVRMSKKVAPANRESFLFIRTLKKNWMLRALKYKLKHIYEKN